MKTAVSKWIICVISNMCEHFILCWPCIV